MPGIRVHITGIVQGVGMRPFVYREAVARGLAGWVLNAGDGVHVEAWGDAEALGAFTAALADNAPAAARVERVAVTALGEDGEADDGSSDGGTFRIVPSEDETAHTTLVSPDIATCPDCLRELFDPADRRFHYPFINCTNCGPRFTIIADLPYDRPKTSMAGFPMCGTCAAEYADPLDRRFHAQPDACFDCGPHITWRERGEGKAAVGATCAESDAIIERCAALLAVGGIVAIKGLGGFHLACDAGNGATVAELRRRKRRSNKPLAVMMRGMEHVEAVCHVDEAERELLTGSVRPIVLLRRQGREDLWGKAGNQNGSSTEPDPTLDQGGAPAGELAATSVPSAPAWSSVHSGLSAVLPPLTERPELSSESEQPTRGAAEQEMTPDQNEAGRQDRMGSDQEPTLDQGGALESGPAATPRLSAPPWSSVKSGSSPAQLPELGVMLPYTPLQHLLLAACADHGITALVMTSGNISGEPIETDDALAWQHLVGTGIADALLGNDRPILSRYDDSVVRVVAGETQLVRRARGYAPMPLDLPPNAAPSPHPAPAILACGPEQKATLALTRGSQCFLSQHIGDVEAAGTLAAWHEARTRMEALFDIHPTALACDLHPSYLTSQWAREQARTRNLPLIEVQHHHAHIASVLAEHGVTGQVIGIAYDGTGAGADGTVWGGELLVADLRGFTRAAHLRTWSLPGGTASVRDARRNALSLLGECELLDHPGAARFTGSLDEATRTLTAQMVEKGLNSPITSSMGRLLDAVAAILGVCGTATYEGEPAILLEAAAQPGGAPRYRLAIADGLLDPEPMLRAMLDDIAAGTDIAAIAWAVHEAIAQATAEAVEDIARRTGIRATALSGGVFMNRLLLTRIKKLLEERGLTVLVPRTVPFNDGCIAYGQAAIATHTL